MSARNLNNARKRPKTCPNAPLAMTAFGIAILISIGLVASHSVQAMVGQKLFSFPPPGRAHLHEEVLQSIEQSSRKLRVIAIVGEGRAGKSQLGNELLQTNAPRQEKRSVLLDPKRQTAGGQQGRFSKFVSVLLILICRLYFSDPHRATQHILMQQLAILLGQGLTH